MKEALLIFAKNLINGEVKTRLAATMGNDFAFSLYKQLLEHTVSITNHLPVGKTIFYSTYIDGQDVWSHDIYEKQIQVGEDLGERMKNAFSYIFDKEYEKAIIIGTDCFEISAAVIMNAFIHLNNHDIVIGPATDGGYYLLGMKQVHAELFQNIYWSTSNVLQQTLAVCIDQNLSVHLLTELSDIDIEKDLDKTKYSYR